MPYFNSPKILFGSSMMKRLGSELQGMGKKAVIITGRNVAGLSAQLGQILTDSGFIVYVWGGAEPEPTTEGALSASQVLAEHEPDLVIGFGGGSAIDTAKAAWVLWERPDITIEEMEKAINPKSKLNLRKKARFMAVPTTSGSGSEVNWAMVLTDKVRERKMGFGNNEIVPDIALLIPEFTAGLPKSLTASTGMDVLGHAFDGYTARQQNDFSDGLCLQAIKLAFEWLPKACVDGNNMAAREKMQNAASIAGLGFGNSNTSLSHALAHAIGATFHMGHGRAVGLALPYSLEYITSKPPVAGIGNLVEKLAAVGRYIGLSAASDQEMVKAIITRIRDLAREIGEPATLQEAGIRQKDFEAKLNHLVTLTSKDVNMYSCPCPCEAQDIEQILKNMASIGQG